MLPINQEEKFNHLKKYIDPINTISNEREIVFAKIILQKITTNFPPDKNPNDKNINRSHQRDNFF